MPMWDRIRFVWLPRFLFGIALLSAAGLVVLVLFAPWLDNALYRPRGWSAVLAVFSRDALLRRTATASALGLAVSAYVFFRPASCPERGTGKNASRRSAGA